MPPIYSSAIMMTKLIEYNDTANTARLDDNLDHVRVYDLVNFGWRQVRVSTTWFDFFVQSASFFIDLH